jgi:nucleotide-binding universal stress UspA family protein
MYNHILVAVDGSATSNSALKEAISLAKDQHSTLHLVHVVDLTTTYSAVEWPYVEYKDALRAAGEKIIADCSAVVGQAGVEFDTASIVIERLDQHIYDAIEEEAKRWKADLIVIGTHGRRGFRRLLLGSVAEGLIRIASKPVLLIRGE